MAIIILCRKCKGQGKMKTKMPFMKKSCPVCFGKGKMFWESAESEVHVSLNNVGMK